jgi:hypothetical protein
MDYWKKTLVVLFLSTLVSANVLTVRWPYTQSATEYKVLLGSEPGVYYFNYLLDASHYKDNFVYSFLFLENGQTYYISYSYKVAGIEIKSGDLKITATVVFPKKPTLELK